MNAPAVMPAIIASERALPATAAQMRAQVNLIQEVMQAVMKDGVHYGKIPGTPKPTLMKPGCEVLAATFRIDIDYEVEDLSGPDFIRYRVKAIGTHQGSGVRLGAGMGECSSLEEKYRWRKASHVNEFNAAAEDRRRIKFFANGDSVQQIQASHHDAANTILKMACKRAQVAMTLNVTAASDIFTQDVEDLPEHLQHDDDETRAAKAKAAAEATEAARKRLETAVNAVNAAPTLDAVKVVWQQHLQGFIDANDRAGADAFKEAVAIRNKFLRSVPAGTPAAEGGAPAKETGTGGGDASPSSSDPPPADGAPKEQPSAQG